MQVWLPMRPDLQKKQCNALLLTATINEQALTVDTGMALASVHGDCSTHWRPCRHKDQVPANLLKLA